MSDKKFFENVIKTLIMVLMWLGLIFYRGLMLSLMWGWFLVPIGMRAITITQAIGISLVFSSMFLYLYTYQTEIRTAVLKYENKDKTKFQQEFTDAIMQYAAITVSLLFGLVWHFFIA